MTNEEALIASILASPHDDAQRLIYADWLEEQGDPRAEYLRLLCKLRGTPPSEGRSQAFHERLKELQTGLETSWLRAMGHRTPVVRWTVPADLPCYGDYDFRMYPGTFDLFFDMVLDRLRLDVDDHRRHYGNIPKQWGRYRAYIDTMAAVDWLVDAAKSGEEVIVWDKGLEDGSIWVHAGTWIYSGEFARVLCSECNGEYGPDQGKTIMWAYGGGLAAHGGHRYVCPIGHTLYAIMEWNS